MNNIYKHIVEYLNKGKIEKQAAVQIIKMLKKQKNRITDDIAVIGMAAKFPGAVDLNDFWENICNGVDCIGNFPEQRQRGIDDYLKNYVKDDFKGQDSNSLNYQSGAYLNDIENFDYNFFRISPKEASLMEPSQRLFLQTAWEAVEDAGYGGEKLKGSKTGVFLGYATSSHYQRMIYDIDSSQMAMSMVGNIAAMTPTRIAYILDLKGPTMIVDTACSSSFVAIYIACQALKNIDCNMAIAGGIRLNLLPLENESMKLGVESSDGRTRTFDDNADGAGWGEGTASVLLKPLSMAEKDGDNIYAVIKGMGINQDGASIGITAPNSRAQADVITQAWENAGIDPETISFIEAHGTATNLGDPLEIEGLQKAFKKYTDRKQFCAISTVKSNMGHLYECAGMAGLMKAVLALKHRKIPGGINFNRPNAKISFSESPVYVNMKTVDWEEDEHPRRCGISAFGLSGTNCHLVLEEYVVPLVESSGDNNGFHILTLSSRKREGLDSLVVDYIDFLNYTVNAGVEDICYTAGVGRGHYNYRLVVISSDQNDLKNKLLILLDKDIEKINEEWFYFGEHKMVPARKKELENNEITGRMKKELTREAKLLTKEYREFLRTDFNNVKKLSCLYVRGGDIDWADIYKQEERKRISLPGYPFEDNSCWIYSNDKITQEDSGNSEKAEQFYSVFWKAEALNYNKIEGNNGEIEDDKVVDKSDGKVLILKDIDNNYLFNEIKTGFKEKGRDIIEVEIADQYKRLSKDKFIIGNTEDGYARLFKNIKNMNIRTVVHMLTLTDNNNINTYEELEESQKKACYSLYYLSRGYLKSGIDKEYNLILLSEYTDEITGEERCIKPENATLFGISRVVQKELPLLNCRCIDLDRDTSIQDLLLEIEYGSSKDVAAYREGKRYIQVFGALESAGLLDTEFAIKDTGVYVITGGTGGIGLEIAKFLSTRKQVNLALISRSKIPERELWDEIIESGSEKKLCRKLCTIKQLEEAGSKVEYYSANIIDKTMVKEVFNDLREKYGRINGVIHGAGLSDDKPLGEKSEDEFEAIISPKIYGTWILDKELSNDQLDFFIMFSSVATIFSAYGQGDYAAANAYLDTFSVYRKRMGKKALTINWTTWKETGMAAESGSAVDTIFSTLATDRAIEGFSKIIGKDLTRVLIGDINYEGVGLYLLDKSNIRLTDSINVEISKHKMNSRKKIRPSRSVIKVSAADVMITGRSKGEYTSTEKLIAGVWGEILGFEEINIYTNFFELGGDSILGVKIANSLSAKTGKQISSVDMLKYLTIEELGRYIDQISVDKYIDIKNSYPPLKPVEEKEYYSASYAQRKMYLANRLKGPNISYNMYRVACIENAVNLKRFEDVLKEIIKRHEVLRTSIEIKDGEIVQKIKKEVNFNVQYFEGDQDSLNHIIDGFRRPFKMNEPPLIRAGLVKLEEEKYMFLCDMHHSITDGVSMEIFREEFARLYQGEELPELTLQYKDFAEWQNRLMKSEYILKQENYWYEKFKDEIPLLNLPTDYKKPDLLVFEGNIVSIIGENDMMKRMVKISSETGASLYMVFLAAYNVLLSKYTAQEDIVVGSPVSGRLLPELENMMGMFINILPIRNQPVSDMTFRSFLQEVKCNTLKDFENQDYQINELVQKLKLPRQLNRHQLFDTIFVFQNITESEEYVDELKCTFYDDQIYNITDYDLTLEIKPTKENLKFTFEYCTKLFKEETVERMLKDYLSIINTINRDLDIKLEDIELQSSSSYIFDYGKEEDIKFNL